MWLANDLSAADMPRPSIPRMYSVSARHFGASMKASRQTKRAAFRRRQDAYMVNDKKRKLGEHRSLKRQVRRANGRKMPFRRCKRHYDKLSMRNQSKLSAARRKRRKARVARHLARGFEGKEFERKRRKTVEYGFSRLDNVAQRATAVEHRLHPKGSQNYFRTMASREIKASKRKRSNFLRQHS